MSAPKQRHRYLGVIRRPDGAMHRELFLSVSDARQELQQRYRTGIGSRINFDYDELGVSVDGGSVWQQDTTEQTPPNTTVEMHPVHRDYLIEPLPHFLITVGPRGGTSVRRLEQGK